MTAPGRAGPPGDGGLPAFLRRAAVGLVAARLPALLALKGYAFSDAGATLTLDRLVADGQRPGVDFVYLYGLLPIAVGRAWFAVWGATPYAFAAGTLVAMAATIAG